jgi:hypothetical protein
MRDFWKRRREQADWPEPRSEFLHELADDIRATKERTRIPRFRLALVLAVAAALLLPLAAFADRREGNRTRETIKAVVSYLQANTVGTRNDTRDNDDDDDGGGTGGGGGGGDDDDDDDEGYRGDDDDDDDDDEDDDEGYRGDDDDDDGDDDDGGGGGGDDDDDGGGGGGGGDDDDD